MGHLRSATLSIISLLGILFLVFWVALSLLAIGGIADLQEPTPPGFSQNQSAVPAMIEAPTLTVTLQPTRRVFCAATIPFPAPTPGPTTTPFPAAPQNPRFGIAWSSSFYNSQRVMLPTGQAIEAGATWDRWPMPWYLVEPYVDGRFRWVHEDVNFFLAATRDRPRYFDPASTDRALKILAVLTGIPEGYVIAQESGGGESILGLGEPVFLTGGDEINPENRWGYFVYQATSTFGDVVDGWEIGNEGGFPLPPATYVRAMEVACRVIARTDPAAEVLLGSPEHPIALRTARGEETTYRALLTALADAVRGDRSLQTCISGLALHVYVQPDYSYYVISQIADLTAGLGWRPALWITETGVQHPARDGPRWAAGQCTETGFHCVSDEEQASYVIQQYVLTAQALAQKQRDGVVIYHRLKDEFDRDPRSDVNDGPWGLLDFDNNVLPAFHAARLVSATLGRAHYVREEGEDDPTYRHLVFVDHAQRLVRVLWATTAQAVTVSFSPRSDEVICYQQNIALCPDEFQSGSDSVLTLTLPGATTQAREDPSDPFYPAPIIGGWTFIVVD